MSGRGGDATDRSAEGHGWPDQGLDWDEVRRVLAVRLDNIGDLVMLTPALRAIRTRLPHAFLSVLASPAGALLSPLLPWVDEVIEHRAVWQDASGSMPLDPEREQALVGNLAERGFDAALIFTSFSQSPYPPAYACYLAGIPIRVAQSKEFGGGVVSHWVTPPPDEGHQVDRNLHLLERVGVAPAGAHLELVPLPAHRAGAEAVLDTAGVDPSRPYAVLAPGASCPSRRYHPDRFAEVAAGLGEQGLAVAVVGSERERALADGVATMSASTRHPVVSAAGRTTVPELAALVSGAALVVTNNSGPMHLADAFGRPTVVLFAGTELEEQWAPRRAPLRLLRRATACTPCRAFECRYQLECLDLPAGEVVAAATGLLGAVGGCPLPAAPPGQPADDPKEQTWHAGFAS